jgi:hypothetical protein
VALQDTKQVIIKLQLKQFRENKLSWCRRRYQSDFNWHLLSLIFIYICMRSRSYQKNSEGKIFLLSAMLV